MRTSSSSVLQVSHEYKPMHGPMEPVPLILGVSHSSLSALDIQCAMKRKNGKHLSTHHRTLLLPLCQGICICMSRPEILQASLLDYG